MNIHGFFPKQQPGLAPSDSNEQQCQEVEAEVRATEIALINAGKRIADYLNEHPDSRLSILDGQTYRRVNAMIADSTLQQLESERNRILQRWHQVLAEYARSRTVSGLTQ
jgi:hypothetical protein